MQDILSSKWLSYLFVDVLVQFLHRFPEQFRRERFEFGRKLSSVQQVGLSTGQEAVVTDKVGGPEVDLLQRLLGEGPHLPGYSGLGHPPVLTGGAAPVGRTSVLGASRPVNSEGASGSAKFWVAVMAASSVAQMTPMGTAAQAG